jgi:hypothetical protein
MDQERSSEAKESLEGGLTELSCLRNCGAHGVADLLAYHRPNTYRASGDRYDFEFETKGGGVPRLLNCGYVALLSYGAFGVAGLIELRPCWCTEEQT